MIANRLECSVMITWIVLVVVQIISVDCIARPRELRSIRHRRFRPAGPPVDLTVSVSVLNITSKHLRLNVSWSPNKEEGDLTKSYNIHIRPMNESDRYCYTEPYYAFIDNKDCRSWQVPGPDLSPGLLDSLRIIAGCSYSIRLEANPHDGKTFAHTNFTVPECVGAVCSCRHADSLPAPKLGVEPMTSHPDAVNISWVLNGGANYIYNITSFIVRAGPHLHGNMYNLSWSKRVEYTADRKYAAELSYWVDYTARNTGSNIATVKAVDTFDCSGPETQLIFYINEDDSPIVNQVSRKEKEFWVTALAIGCTLAVLSLMIIVIFRKKYFWFIYRDRNSRFGKRRFFYKPVGNERVGIFRKHNSLQERNVLYVEKEIEDARSRGDVDRFEISARRLEFQRWIGHGAFGRVFLARADAICGVPGTQLVAVKTLKAGVEEDQREEFLKEMSMLKHVGRHANVVSLLACVTMADDLCIVMEHVPCGDMLNYLRTLRQQLDNRKPSVASMSEAGYPSTSTMITGLYSQRSDKTTPPYNEEGQLEKLLNHRELHNFAVQISRGMAHLEAKNITHRDLAARNILIDEKKTLKISDFGLSRRGVYVNTKKRKVPLRWLSLEAMTDSLYSTKSDVWAFAIVLWEIGTLGGFPYPTVSDYDLLKFLNQGHRLEKPDIVSDDLYRVMRICWSAKPGARPSFAELMSYLETKSGDHIYVEIIANPRLPPTVEYANIDLEFNKT